MELILKVFGIRGSRSMQAAGAETNEPIQRLKDAADRLTKALSGNDVALKIQRTIEDGNTRTN
jgi:hypothetical protein